MSFVSYQPGASASGTASASSAAPALTVGGGGLRVISPDAVDGAPHLVVEAPWAPIATGWIDLADTAEQVVEVIAQGRYIADSVIVWGADGAPGAASLAVRTLDAARGGGRLLASGLDLSGLSGPKGLAEAAIAAGAILSAPHLYVTASGGGTGRVRLQLFGRLVALEDPQARTYDPRGGA
ncbi:hypothetical protein [Limimaricola hongkongensis]|uniref:Uncharacterized protein n=1 Tax=Limimaricola hongkongensis DSM 17492 TaxID=1122180 RepID=A0A017HDE9_9RHOB|nr:hypothetical protein [Limimaricola hongkongensis]EYD71824.1 hypothetical protein Lokhon_01894 [Limimaricola hongkongensis DSM 17492]